MSKTFLHLYCSLILSILITSCSNAPTQENSNSQHTKKAIPNDYFLLQRVNAGKGFDHQTYKEALVKVANSLNEKTNHIGLDQDWVERGPSNIGARINTIAVNPENENIIYTGFAGGGVFKSTDDGATWTPIFDDNSFLAIGDITLDPSNPSTIYVGTGDPNISGYPFIGNGIYKSTDAGENWINIGLEEESIISKIIVSPQNSNVIYAGAMGIPFERNDQRGLYKSTDAGATWEQVLFVSDQAGIIDFVLSPTDPNTIYAASWNRIRNNHESLVSGPDAKIFKSIDGGTSWEVLENGLPLQDTMGRIGLAISSTNPNKIYALYVNSQSQLENIYKTTDAGASWQPTINWGDPIGLANSPLGGFGWYFGKIRVHPDNDEKIYILGVNMWESEDGGINWNFAISFENGFYVHADKHDLVFTPNGNKLLATDGGLYKTNQDGIDWIDHDNTPTTQFYRVAYNPHHPDMYFGGSQDNGSIGGKSTDEPWNRLYGGDGFQLIFHPDDPAITYAQSQNGNIAVSLDSTWQSWNIATTGIFGEDRRNWDMQYILSPHDPNTMYTGTYRVYKSILGPIPSWAPVSEDLTDGQILADRFHTITTIAESKAQQGLVYVGTTDGNVWRSDYGGENFDWKKLSNNLPDEYVTAVVPSPDNIDKVYVSHSGYKENDNTAKIFRSNNRGSTWESIAGDLPALAINDIYVLGMHNDSVITVATDGGVYITKNSGQNWHRMGNMPVIPVYDIEYNEVNKELIAGTFARSIQTYSLDDINDYLTPSSTIQLLENDISISPNPAKSYFKIKLTNYKLEGKSIQLSIFNIEGKKVHSVKLTASSQIIEIDNIPTGIFHIVLFDKNIPIGTKKIIITK